MPQVVRVKIYDASMAVISSDDPRLAGQPFLDNAQLLGAVAGRTTISPRIGEKSTSRRSNIIKARLKMGDNWS